MPWVRLENFEELNLIREGMDVRYVGPRDVVSGVQHAPVGKIIYIYRQGGSRGWMRVNFSGRLRDYVFTSLEFYLPEAAREAAEETLEEKKEENPTVSLDVPEFKEVPVSLAEYPDDYLPLIEVYVDNMGERRAKVVGRCHNGSILVIFGDGKRMGVYPRSRLFPLPATLEGEKQQEKT